MKLIDPADPTERGGGRRTCAGPGLAWTQVMGDNALGATSTLTNSLVVGYAPVLDTSNRTVYLDYNSPITPLDVGDDRAFPIPTYTVDSGTLPTGLILSSGTGIISGTPTK